MTGITGDGLPPDGLRDTERLSDGTPLVDPGSLPRRGYSGDAKREHAIYDASGLGRLAGRVRVTPVRRRDREVWFEVAAEWGPDTDGRDVIGLSGQPSHHATDMFAAAAAEGAMVLARLATERLAAAPAFDPYALDAPRRPPLDLAALASLLGVEPFEGHLRAG